MNFKKSRLYITIICLCFLWAGQVNSQIPDNAIPLSALEGLPEITDFMLLEKSPDCEDGQQSQSNRSLNNVSRFACPIPVDLDPNHTSQWMETPEGSVWRLGIQSEDAYSLYLTMQYQLLPGVKLFVYGPGYRNFQGAFTSRNNNPAQTLSIAPVSGDKIIIELNLPPVKSSFGTLVIKKVYHDYLNIVSGPDKHGGKSLRHVDCFEDINCENGKYWQTEKRSVCKIISNGLIGTGTLIGNTAKSNAPYIITANHLIPTPEKAAEALFVFNDESSGCYEGPGGNSVTLSGATLLSTSQQVDYTLMMLNERPPVSVRPFYAGWDVRGNIPKSGTCIHHPFGNTKQIAIEYHPILNEDVGEGFAANSTWKISHWELGVTEVGSSGAPLFDETHRVVGSLTGGRATCGFPKDDYFTKLSASWRAHADPDLQLHNWLDSANIGQLVIDGYDPYGFNVEYCDTAWNFLAFDNLVLEKSDLSWGWISGHNSAGYTQFAERFEPAGSLQIEGVYLHIAKAYAANPLSNIKLKVWEGMEYPEVERYSKLLFIKNLQSDQINYIPFDSILSQSEPFFVGYEINYAEVTDTFSVYHAPDRKDGMISSAFLYDGRWSMTKDQKLIRANTSFGIGISSCYGSTRIPATRVLNVYPNPTSGSLTLDMPGRAPIDKISCFDIYGRKVKITLHQGEIHNQLYFNLKQGIYFLEITAANIVYTSRFVVLEP